MPRANPGQVHYLYWIHYPEHTDPLIEGYVGVTCDLDYRLETHFTRPENPILKNVMQKDRPVMWTVLHTDLDEAEAYSIEKQYRPDPEIGWNIAPGGDRPPSPKGRPRTKKQLEYARTKSPEHKASLSKLMTERNKSAENSQRVSERNRQNWEDPAYRERMTAVCKANSSHVAAAGRKMQSTIFTCPHCTRTGKGSGFIRWHFDKCRDRLP